MKNKTWTYRDLTDEINRQLKTRYAISYIADINRGYRQSSRVEIIMKGAIKKLEGK